MSAGYQAVGWNRQKKVYDLVLVSGLVGYLGLAIGIGAWWSPHATAETLLLRALGTAAFLLLHVTLAIGPLCRIDRRFLPLLYNRRHLGVTLFLVALAHGGLALVQFHSQGVLDPLTSVMTNEDLLTGGAPLPFQALGVAALLILAVMAATSHDFWLAQFTAPVWKALHSSVYLAYALLVAHVAWGAGQTESGGVILIVTALGACALAGLHGVAARRELRVDDGEASRGSVEVRVCSIEEIPEGRAKVVSLGGERVAVFRHQGKLSAVSNVCQHQNGPLGEGRILQGCITCPWHGYQYLPETGASPPPFKERVPIFAVRISGPDVFIDPRPRPAGQWVAPATLP